MSPLKKGASSEPHSCSAIPEAPNLALGQQSTPWLWAPVGRAHTLGQAHIHLLLGQPYSSCQILVGQQANLSCFNVKNMIEPAMLKMLVLMVAVCSFISF